MTFFLLPIGRLCGFLSDVMIRALDDVWILIRIELETFINVAFLRTLDDVFPGSS
jgi:hypothetical protein